MANWSEFFHWQHDNGNPTLETLISVLSALGLELAEQKRAA
jgi:DNA-binding phage protein